ncbi:hypothetical protein Cgig2_011489 [Carnegiea gigantea]|uniref:Uncharacterized protein n=1 Tax=Carnegiea gigantea TaxID=171969 RepID=A0A9Q1KSN8_9CARY|nr:hypothetical protein Cgig2_011489 [Carnegiea gigantea]
MRRPTATKLSRGCGRGREGRGGRANRGGRNSSGRGRGPGRETVVAVAKEMAGACQGTEPSSVVIPNLTNKQAQMLSRAQDASLSQQGGASQIRPTVTSQDPLGQNTTRQAPGGADTSFSSTRRPPAHQNPLGQAQLVMISVRPLRQWTTTPAAGTGRGRIQA